jgi:hypothetical protein
MDSTAHLPRSPATPTSPSEALANRRATAEELVRRFWAAPSEALFRQDVIAAVLCKSAAWCERMRWQGGVFLPTEN